MKKFYVTTSIMYANSAPHAGFALELIQADVLARWHRLNGDKTHFLTGTDEHGATVVRAAKKQNKSPQELVDEVADKVKCLAKVLNISNDDFIRTSDQRRHWPAAIKIWRELFEVGALYKKEYEGLYCVGHEAFMKKSELVDGKCVLHGAEPEKIKEENWFFKLTDYKKEIKDKIERGELKILPESRKHEILNLLDDAEDVSFSRPSKDLAWGIPVPDDSTQTMYVWCDALTNYISALGYGADKMDMGFWPADVHLIGKDILRFHAMIWPAMLLAIKLPLPKAIYVHGFVTVNGHKMSKTLGNVIDPFELLKQYDSEVIRYFLLREIPSGDDGEFSYKNLEARYNGDLANGLGNLVQRVATLIDDRMAGELIYNSRNMAKDAQVLANFLDYKAYKHYLDNFRLHDALAEVWAKITLANQYIDERKPWATLAYDEAEFLHVMTVLTAMIHHINWLLQPFMPATAEKIKDIFSGNDSKEIPENYKFVIKKGEVLFPRLK